MKDPDSLGSPRWGERLAERGCRELSLVVESSMARMGWRYCLFSFWDTVPP